MGYKILLYRAETTRKDTKRVQTDAGFKTVPDGESKITYTINADLKMLTERVNAISRNKKGKGRIGPFFFTTESSKIKGEE
jgi:hypothetical protein